MAVNGTEGVALEWDAINWRLHEDNVGRLRRRIFKAAQEQDLATVRSLQKMMLRSWSNTLLSVRQVTQRNTGRKTAGIDRGDRAEFPGQDGAGGASASKHPHLESPARQAGVCTEGKCEAPPARHSRDHGPVSPEPG